MHDSYLFNSICCRVIRPPVKRVTVLFFACYGFAAWFHSCYSWPLALGFPPFSVILIFSHPEVQSSTDLLWQIFPFRLAAHQFPNLYRREEISSSSSYVTELRIHPAPKSIIIIFPIPLAVHSFWCSPCHLINTLLSFMPTAALIFRH